jgi:hypothetical protein
MTHHHPQKEQARRDPATTWDPSAYPSQRPSSWTEARSSSPFLRPEPSPYQLLIVSCQGEG